MLTSDHPSHCFARLDDVWSVQRDVYVSEEKARATRGLVAGGGTGNGTQCERNASCTRGFKHGGRGGLCTVRKANAPASSAADGEGVAEAAGPAKPDTASKAAVSSALAEEESGAHDAVGEAKGGDDDGKVHRPRGLIPTGVTIAREVVNDDFERCLLESGAHGARLLATDFYGHRYWQLVGTPLMVQPVTTSRL